MSKYLKTVYRHVDTITDKETGEVLDVQIAEHSVLVTTKEEFVQLYTSVESKLYNLPLSAERVWTYCILHCQKDNIITFTAYDKTIIKEKWGLGFSTTANALTTLVNNRLLIKTTSKSVYRVNPNYAWKGTSNDRNKLLKYVLTVECPDC